MRQNQPYHPLNLQSLPSGDIGRNLLDFTTYFLEREERIHQFINDYVQIVGKNIEDTKANVRSLKDQDEAITRN